jgi:hypothetical protein
MSSTPIPNLSRGTLESESLEASNDGVTLSAEVAMMSVVRARVSLDWRCRTSIVGFQGEIFYLTANASVLYAQIDMTSPFLRRPDQDISLFRGRVDFVAFSRLSQFPPRQSASEIVRAAGR